MLISAICILDSPIDFRRSSVGDRSLNHKYIRDVHSHYSAVMMGVSNHQPHDCLLYRLCVTGQVTGEFHTQMASNAEKLFHLMTSSWVKLMIIISMFSRAVNCIHVCKSSWPKIYFFLFVFNLICSYVILCHVMLAINSFKVKFELNLSLECWPYTTLKSMLILVIINNAISLYFMKRRVALACTVMCMS